MNSSTIFTIGYEGIQIEEYIEKLQDNNIKVLIDVRKNPISRKKGFSKTKLSEALSKKNIEYIHLPNLGIDSNLRKDLDIKNLDTYKALFEYYDKHIVPAENESLDIIISIACENKNIALTCFEKDYEYCHRSRITKSIEERNYSNLIFQHI